MIYAVHGESGAASPTDRLRWGKPTFRRTAAIATLWAMAFVSGSMIVSGGFQTYYQYEDHRGVGPVRAEYLGPDLRDELRAGERFVFTREFEKFDRDIENRLLALYGLGALSLIETAMGLATYPRPIQK